MISREKLRGKPLDRDCKQAHRTTHEYGMEDDRVYCKEWEEPCRRCRRNCKDYWRRGAKE